MFADMVVIEAIVQKILSANLDFLFLLQTAMEVLYEDKQYWI